jgi:hypothetical protein
MIKSLDSRVKNSRTSRFYINTAGANHRQPAVLFRENVKYCGIVRVGRKKVGIFAM